VSPRRGQALAIALLTAALAGAGCGVGAGEDVGEVSLLVTREYGEERLAGPVDVEVNESDTAMRVLDREAEVETAYGGRFVQSIEGLKGTTEGGRPYDWFFYVNGLWSPLGAAEYDLRGGEAVWWDYRDWSASTRVSAVVGSWPHPFAGGYEGERHPTALECRGGGESCAVARRRLLGAGAELAAAGAEGAIRILVGPWARVRRDPTAADLEDGPGVSGVYAEPARGGEGFELRGLDAGGEPARAFGPGSGLVAATRRGDAPPVWVVTGPTRRGALAAARSLDAATLRDRYAVAVDAEGPVPLPVEAP
jgi:hypothetical protein